MPWKVGPQDKFVGVLRSYYVWGICEKLEEVYANVILARI